MKKNLLLLALAAISLVASAEVKTYFFEDFEWFKPWTDTSWGTSGVAGNTVGDDDPNAYAPQISKKVSINGIDKNLADSLINLGYEFPITYCEASGKANRTWQEQVYMQRNYLKLGLTDFFSGITLPAIADLGDGVSNAKISFDWCPMCTAKARVFDKVNLVVVIKNGEQEYQKTVPAHSFEDNSKFAWIPADIDLNGISLTKETRITIRPADDQFPATATGKVFRYFLDNIKLYADGNAAVGEIADENAPVVYYNLQGVKVANPENGVFIRRQGSKVTKVVM